MKAFTLFDWKGRKGPGQNQKQLNGSSTDCPGCGVARELWVEGGILFKGSFYCCEGCAAGTTCICGTNEQAG